MNREDYLFAQGDLSASLRAQEKRVEEAAQAIPSDHALARSVDELAAELVEWFRIEPLALDESAVTMSHRDAQVDVSHDPMRFILDEGRPFYVSGTTLTYHVPVSGELDLFKMRPSHYTLSPPHGAVSDGELRVSATVPAPVPDNIKDQMDRVVDQIRTYIRSVNADVAEFNAKLSGLAKVAAERRRSKVIADHDLAAKFGIPARRADAPKTYAAPPVKRSVKPRGATGTPARPLEPVLPSEEYEHVLAVARQMVMVMERSPKSFARMNEEAIRDHFLVQLNGQYEGDATGETFNFEGKTDILIRKDGRNLFVGECKFWRGAKALAQAIDQLLGYTSWRDTKTAVFLFNRTKELTRVLAQIAPTVAAHPAFVRQIEYAGETDFRFVLRHRDDPQRELTLTVLVFEVPA